MRENDWKNVKEIFLEATERPFDERATFIAEKCGEDTELLNEVQSLLASHDSDTQFIEKPAVDLSSVLSNGATNGAGKTLGNYKIGREIGRGGMGAVFLAERDDGEFQQQVAIKVLGHALPDSEIVRYFKREREILASLNHPLIARLLDGGLTPEGLPYFVMEYVEGVSVLEFATRENLSINERLHLFTQICEAVGFAHRNFIVHRDIKPNNILVTNDGTPKLLDFGLAKMINPNIAKTDVLQPDTAFLAMTPAYASPEQMRGQPITTASDIYSLGIVLFELLTNERPYQFDTDNLAEIVRVVCETEPTRPSSRLSPKSKVQSPKSEKQGLNPKSKIQNPKLLQGDIDNIVLMALRKEPLRRYQTAEQFAEDIKRHLNSLPVVARQNTFKYRASKFVKRNTIGVLAATLIFLSLIGGIAATLWQSRQTQKEKEKAESINVFLGRLLRYSNPIYKSLQKGGQEATINDVLDEAADRLRQGEFDNQPEVKAELLHTVAQSYSGQGKLALAAELLQEYVDLTDKIYDENHPKRIESLSVLATLTFSKGKMNESEKLYRQVLPRLRDEQTKGNIKAEVLADGLNIFAYLRRTQGDSHEAETLFRESLALNPQMPADEANYINGTTQSVLASTLADQGRFDEALQTSREGVEEQRRNGWTKTPTFGFNLTVLSGFLTEKGEFAEADAHLKEAEDIFRKNLSSDNLWLGDNLRNQAISFYFQAKYTEAIQKADETLKMYATFGKHYDHYPTALIFKGLSLAKIGQTNEGEKLLREAVKLRTDSLPKEHFWVAIAESALGECLMIEKKYAEAEPLLRESYESLKNSQGAQNPRTILAQNRLVKLYQDWNKPELAAKMTSLH